MSKSNANTTAAAIRLSEAHWRMLSAAVQREDRCLTRPASLRGAQIMKLRETLIAAGYAREVKTRGSAPAWRQENGTTFALKLTTAGANAVVEEATPVAKDVVTAGANAFRLTKEAPPPEAAAREGASGTSSLPAPLPAQSEPRARRL